MSIVAFFFPTLPYIFVYIKNKIFLLNAPYVMLLLCTMSRVLYPLNGNDAFFFIINMKCMDRVQKKTYFLLSPLAECITKTMADWIIQCVQQYL